MRNEISVQVNSGYRRYYLQTKVGYFEAQHRFGCDSDLRRYLISVLVATKIEIDLLQTCVKYASSFGSATPCGINQSRLLNEERHK